MADWLIVRTIRLAGDRMGTWLDGLKRLGFDPYYPMIREMKRVPRRELSRAQRDSGVNLMRPRVLPFLPQHVLVEEQPEVGRLMSHPGVIGFVYMGEAPAFIREREVEGLRKREAAGGGAIPGATPVELIFNIGDRVQVLNGAFTQLEGIVEQAPDVPIEQIDARTRLKLTVDLFGRRTPVDATVADVRKL
jgi:transcription antitermination factor NusG